VDIDEIRSAIEAFNEKGDDNDYADAIELGNQIIAESPYPYQIGSVYLKGYDGGEGFRIGGLYASQNQQNPIVSKPDEDCLKFRTPLEGKKGKLTAVSEGTGDTFKEFVGEDLNKFKWNPWLYPHDPNHELKRDTHNVLKSLEYGYKDLPMGEGDFTDHSPHLVILYTGHE